MGNNREKKKDRLRFRVFLVLAAIFLLHRIFIEDRIIGGNAEYGFYILIMPTGIGAAFFFYIYRRELFYKLSQAEKIFEKLILSVLLLSQLFLFSFLSFSLVSRIAWDLLNKSTTKNNAVEEIQTSVIKISEGSRRQGRKVYFDFMNAREHIDLKNEDYKEFFKYDPEDLKIELKLRKGIWDYYVVDDYRILVNSGYDGS